MDLRPGSSQPPEAPSRVNVSPTIVGEPITWVIRRSTYKTEEPSDGLPIFNHSGFSYIATAPGAGSISWHIKCVNHSNQDQPCFVQGVRHKDGRLLMLRKHNHPRTPIMNNPPKRGKKIPLDSTSETQPQPTMDVDLLLPVPPPSKPCPTFITARYLSLGSDFDLTTGSRDRRSLTRTLALAFGSNSSRSSSESPSYDSSLTGPSGTSSPTLSVYSSSSRSTPPSLPPPCSVKTPQPSAKGSTAPSIAPASSVKTPRSSTTRSARQPPPTSSVKTTRSSTTRSSRRSTPSASTAKTTRSSTTRSSRQSTPSALTAKTTRSSTARSTLLTETSASPVRTRRSLTKALNSTLPPASAGRTSKSSSKVLNLSAPASIANGKGHTKNLLSATSASPVRTRGSLTKALHSTLPPASAGRTSKSSSKVLNLSAPASIANGKGHTKNLRETKQPRNGRRQKNEVADGSLLSRMQSRWKAARRKSTLKSLRSAVEMGCL